MRAYSNEIRDILQNFLAHVTLQLLHDKNKHKIMALRELITFLYI